LRGAAAAPQKAILSAVQREDHHCLPGVQRIYPGTPEGRYVGPQQPNSQQLPELRYSLSLTPGRQDAIASAIEILQMQLGE